MLSVAFFIVMLSVIMLDVVMLSVAFFTVMLSVVKLDVVMLSAMAPHFQPRQLFSSEAKSYSCIFLCLPGLGSEPWIFLFIFIYFLLQRLPTTHISQVPLSCRLRPN
jgi:hypothetical protein